MLARARRLVFEGDVYRDCITSFGKYTINCRLDGQWGARKDGSHLCSPVATEKEAIEACQADFDKRWLAETEVMPLEWEEIDSEGRYCMAETSICEYYVDKKGDGFVWYFVYGNDDSDGQQSCDSRDHGKQLCNAHHRKIVLGE